MPLKDAQAQQVGVVATWPPDDCVKATAASKADFEQACARRGIFRPPPNRSRR